MQKIILHKIPELKFTINSSGTEFNEYTVNITDSSISFKITCDYTPETGDDTYQKTILDYTLPISAVRNFAGLKSNTLLGVLLSSNDMLLTTLTHKNLVNISAATKNHKAPNSISAKNGLSTACYLQLFVKDVNGDFSDFDIIIVGGGPEGTFNLNCNKQVQTIENLSHVTLVDTITSNKDTSYSNADYDKYTVTTESYVDEVYIEPVFGILDRTRVSLTNGTGHFRVLKSSLDGTPFRAKLGFANYSGIADAE